jgi:hypothetical protein
MPFFVAFFPHGIDRGYGRKKILVLEIVSEAGRRLNIFLSTFA